MDLLALKHVPDHEPRELNDQFLQLPVLFSKSITFLIPGITIHARGLPMAVDWIDAALP